MLVVPWLLRDMGSMLLGASDGALARQEGRGTEPGGVQADGGGGRRKAESPTSSKNLFLLAMLQML